MYDPAIRDSINIATMLAAQRNEMVVSPSLAEQIQERERGLVIARDLRLFHWQSRTQVYRWAYEHLLPGCSPLRVTGLPPSIAASLRPFLVAAKGFIYWLDPRNVIPDFRARGLSESYLMREILRAFPPGAAHLGWFIDEGVGTTFSSLSAHPVLASDYLSNLELWASVPASPSSGQATRQTSTPPLLDPQKMYLSFTMSDGDNLQYDLIRLLHLWHDPARGSVPIGWTISPALIEAAPTIAHYYRETATENDDLIAGPSGAGYMYPSFWPSSHLSFFLKRTGRLMQAMQLETLQVLDSNILQSLPLTLRAFSLGAGMALINKERQHHFARALAPFGVRGILSGAGQRRARWQEAGHLPIYQSAGIVKSMDETLALMNALVRSLPRPCFLNLYVLAWTMTPSDLKQVMETLSDECEVVTPTTLFSLLPCTKQG